MSRLPAMSRDWMKSPWPLLASVVFSLFFGSSSFGEDWAEAMFDHTSYNFGVVARGQKVEHRFPVENIYLEDVRIAAVHTSCTCTSPKFTKELLKTREQGEIVAVVDTRKFLGAKEATLRVVFSEPFPAEVQLHCYVYIRSDVVLEPGAIQLGSVAFGEGGMTKNVISYAGKETWKVLGVEHDNPYLDVQVTETGRKQVVENGQKTTHVTYDMVTKLKPDAPVGYVNDHVVLRTNDDKTDATRVVVLVEGVVAPSVEIRPSPLQLGVVQPGQTVTRNLVVQGRTPFKIADITCSDPRFKIIPPEPSKAVHVIPITFTAGQTPGRVAATLVLQTEMPGHEALEVKVDGQVVAVSP